MSSGENKYLFFMLLGALGISTGILDYFVFSSNLELFVVADLVSLGFYFMFFYSLKTLRISGSLLLATLSTLIVIALFFFNTDWPKSDIHFYSKYGYEPDEQSNETESKRIIKMANHNWKKWYESVFSQKPIYEFNDDFRFSY